MKNQKTSRPLLVWVIVIIFSLLAASQICIQSFLLSADLSSLPQQQQEVIESRSALDVLAPYIEALILIVCIIQLFRLQKSSIPWLVLFTSIVYGLLIRKALTTQWLAMSGINGALLGFGGNAFFILVLGYLFWLKQREILL